MPNGLARSTPAVWAVAATTATAATPGSRHGHGRTANAYRYPAGVRNPNHGSLITRTAMITTNTVKNTAITRGRTRHAGCRVNIHSIHAAARPHRARSMARDPHGGVLDPRREEGQGPQQHVRPGQDQGKHPPRPVVQLGERHRTGHRRPPHANYSQRNNLIAASPNTTA